MTDFALSTQLAASAPFTDRVQVAILEKATLVKAEDPIINADRSVSAITTKRQNLADEVLRSPSLCASRVAPLVATDDAVLADYENGDQATIQDDSITTAVSALWDTVAGVRPEDQFNLTRDELANNPGFQRRVYQLCADLANSVVASAPYSGEDAALLAADKTKRLFAVRFQAGKYITPQFMANFASNVVSDPTIAQLTDPNDITDQMILARLTTLVGMFVKGQTELTAMGVDTGLLV